MSEFVQQLINGLSLGAIYALIALGYTMVYGVLRFINFAHSDVFMIGAFTGYYLAPQVNKALAAHSFFSGTVVLFAAMAVCAALGIVIERLAYRPLRDKPRINSLITAIGISLLLEYGGQHPGVFGPTPQPFPTLVPDISRPIVRFASVEISRLDALVLAEPLDLAEQSHVAGAVAPAAAGRAARLDQTQPVVLPERLRVHAGHPGRDGDDQHLRVGLDADEDLVGHAAPPTVRRMAASRCSRGAGGIAAA